MNCSSVWIFLVVLGSLSGAANTQQDSNVPVLTLLLRGVPIPENEALDKEDVGTDIPGALSLVTPYSGSFYFRYPNDDEVPGESRGYFWIVSAERFSNGSRIIRLRRRRDEEQSNNQEGVWRCSFPSDANGGQQSIYFGLYTRRLTSNGVLRISSPPTLTAVSPLLTEPPTYTLTAITTGGPPGSVSWTAGSTVFTDNTVTLTTRSSATYTHTLMLTGRPSGAISFTVTNRRTSPFRFAQITVFPDSPNIQAMQVEEREVQIAWTRVTAATNGYRLSVTGQPSISLPSAVTSLTISNLLPSTLEISIVSLSSLDRFSLYSSRATDTVQVLALPTPDIMSSSSVLSSTSLRVQWSLSSGRGCKPADEFIITYTRTSCPPEDTGSVTVDGLLRARSIEGLEEFSTYTITVTAVYRFGGSNPPVMKNSIRIILQTLSAALAGAPQGLSGQSMSSTSITVTWDEVTCLNRNGPSVITGYMIRYVGDSQTTTDSSSGASRTYTAEGLIPFTEYSFSVAAVNNAGTGPFFETPLTLRTSENSPGEVDSPTLTLMFTSMVVSWSPPVRPNGIITQYEVSYSVNATTDKVNTTLLNFTISSLEPGTNVTITVRAFTSIGPGEGVTLTNSTLNIPSPVSNVQVSTIDATSVRVTWEPLDIPEITGYRVYYSLSESRKRQSDSFIEVEGRETNSATIGGLISGATYSFSVVGVARLEGDSEEPTVGERGPRLTHTVLMVTTSHTVLMVTTSPNVDQYIGVGAVIGIAIGAVIIILAYSVVVLIVCLWKNKHRSQHNLNSNMEFSQNLESDHKNMEAGNETVYEEIPMATKSPTVLENRFVAADYELPISTNLAYMVTQDDSLLEHKE